MTIDDDLLAEALRISGVDGNAAVLREGLRALIERECARRLARLGGSDKKIKPVTRRRTNRA